MDAFLHALELSLDAARRAAFSSAEGPSRPILKGLFLFVSFLPFTFSSSSCSSSSSPPPPPPCDTLFRARLTLRDPVSRYYISRGGGRVPARARALARRRSPRRVLVRRRYFFLFLLLLLLLILSPLSPRPRPSRAQASKLKRAYRGECAGVQRALGLVCRGSECSGISV